ncbi:MAG TPA: hypothetical protein ENJ32_10790 [Crenotrichaceae bacterium]|nr:hypothetical protein [Crenotrichaceae bacterium]
MTDAGGIISLNLNTARGQSGGVECYNCAPTRLITGGELATITIGTPPILTPKPEGLSGLWFDPMLEGEGYNVINAANGMIVYYYGYSAGGQRLWLLSDLYTQAVEFGKDIELGVAEFKGGTFLLPLGSQMASSGWGTLTINFLSCDKATFTLVGVDGNKTSQVVKLAGIVNTDC